MSRTLRASVAGMALLLSACAGGTGPALAPVEQANDPLEGMNRYFFEVNRGVDQIALKPLATIYDGVTPTTIRYVVRNVLDYAKSPVVLANDLFQGEWDRAESTLVRFIYNTTLGGLGMLDPATELGYPRHDEDFGQTLAVAGLPEGPYLILPLLGPTNARDLLGSIVDTAFDPLTFVYTSLAVGVTKRGVSAVEFRATNMDAIDDIEASSADYYATVRSIARQRRNAAILNGNVDTDALPDISLSDEPGDTTIN